VVGTPAYLAPEVARGAGADFASDVFSLGATLYAAVEGGQPFGSHENTIVLLQAVAAGAVIPPKRAGGLEPVLGWLLRTDPAERPDMVRTRAALTAVAEGRPAITPTGTLALPAIPPSPNEFRSHRRALTGAFVAVALVAAGVLAGVLITDGGEPAGQMAAGSPSTAHTRGVPLPSTSPSDIQPAAGTTTCVADYTVTNSWPGGYQALVTVTNPGGGVLDGWTVSWDLPDGQTITNLWNGALSQAGTAVTVGNTSYNATMAANASTTFGFLGGGAGTASGDNQPTVHCQPR
jgi:hypothetical protein